jgi:hypothetical protein
MNHKLVWLRFDSARNENETLSLLAAQHNGLKSILKSHLTTIPVEPGFLRVLLSLKTCSLYHEKLFIPKFKVKNSQVLNNFFSASDNMEAVRGRFFFYRYECKAK